MAPSATTSPRPRIDAARHAAPRAFASAAALEREQMLGAAVRWPRPSRLLARLVFESRRVASAMQALGVNTLGDLLEHLPTDSRQVRTVAALRADEQATVS